MFKHIFVPLSIPYSQEETYANPAEVERLRQKLAAAVDSAEAEMDELLSDGYQIVAHQLHTTTAQTQLVYALHKPGFAPPPVDDMPIEFWQELSQLIAAWVRASGDESRARAAAEIAKFATEHKYKIDNFAMGDIPF